MKFTKQTIYIGLFAILYLIVAFSSFWHACAFFGLANNSWMSIILAFAFEIGQAAVLFSLLTSKKDRSRVMPWVLMTMFTLVQVIGNVFSSYKYIINNSIENLRYFKEPIFIWTTLPDDQATVIIVYIVGAILPICALLLTSMITNYLSDQEEAKQESQELIDKENKEKLQKAIDEAPEAPLIVPEEKEVDGPLEGEGLNDKQEIENLNVALDKKDEEIEELKKQLKLHEENPLINEHSILQMEKQGLEESNQKKDKEIEELKKQLEEKNKLSKDEKVKSDNDNGKWTMAKLKDQADTEDKTSESPKETSKGEPKVGNPINPETLKQAEALISGGSNKKKRDSHFINN